MSITSSQLYGTYESVKKLVQDYPAMQESFAQVSVQFEDKVKTPGISVMVYGIYNAGKSTLINALVGQEVAPTGDIPLTDKVSSYRWNNHTILDTPGVDAPLAHEEVTKAQMMTADAIIFVVNPSGLQRKIKHCRSWWIFLKHGKNCSWCLTRKTHLVRKTLFA